MKKVLFLVCFGLAFVILQSTTLAQITISASDFVNLFSPGKSEMTFSNFNISSETMNVGIPSSSASQSWSLPSFPIQDTARIDNVLPSSTPFMSDFPSAEYAETFSLNTNSFSTQFYNYFLLSNDSMLAIGAIQHMSGTIAGRTIDTIMMNQSVKLLTILPIALGDIITDSPDTTMQSGIMKISTTSVKYDAYGTLTLPNGSFQALRSYSTANVKEYSNGSLISSNTNYLLTWNTVEGHQFTVTIDSGATSGTVSLHTISVTYLINTPTLIEKDKQMPEQFKLGQNYPNPFNPTTLINYQLPSSSYVTLNVYNVLGQEVKSLVNGEQSVGYHSVSFDGSGLQSGVYFYRIRAGNFSQTKKLMLLK